MEEDENHSGGMQLNSIEEDTIIIKPAESKINTDDTMIIKPAEQHIHHTNLITSQPAEQKRMTPEYLPTPPTSDAALHKFSHSFDGACDDLVVTSPTNEEVQDKDLFTANSTTIGDDIVRLLASDDPPTSYPFQLRQNHCDWLLEGIHRKDSAVLGLCDKLSKEFKFILPSDKSDKTIEVTLDQLLSRCKFYLKYEIPGAEPSFGYMTAATFRSCTQEPWCWVKKMAWEGDLDQYASGTNDVLEAIDQRFLKRKYSRPAVPVPKPVIRDFTAASFKTPRLPNSIPTITSAKETSLPPRTPRRQTTPKVAQTPPPKRKREATADVTPKDSSKKPKRQYFDPNDTRMIPAADRFGKNIKVALNVRSDRNDDYEAFSDAVLPDNGISSRLSRVSRDAVFSGPEETDLGDSTGLHEHERSICKKMKISYDTYRCQKARFFIGLALYTEQNRRALNRDPHTHVWNVGVAQTQLFGNMDANKLAYMVRAFQDWGWVRDMDVGEKAGNKKTHKVRPQYLESFPADHRDKLMNELIAWEDSAIHVAENKLAERH